MKISLSPRSIIALMSLSFIMQETHEIAHTGVGRIICGCWGKRNFNLWGLCKECAEAESLTLLATYAGPFYTYAFIWTGFYLLHKTSAKLQSIGLALIVSSMPFSRVLTPIFGGGDIIYALNRSWDHKNLAWAVGLTIVLLLLLPPVIKLGQIIENRSRTLWLIGLLLIPFLMVGLVVFGILQGLLLENGILSNEWIMGSPALVSIWLILNIMIFIITASSIRDLLKPANTVVLG